MRASSPDLNERLVRAVADGRPKREAARRFGVAVTTVKRAVVRQRETGSLERNDRRATIEWQFTNRQARVKLKKLYSAVKACVD